MLTSVDTCLLFIDISWEIIHNTATVGLNKVHKFLTDRNLTINDKNVCPFL